MKKGGLAMRCLAAVAGMTAILAWAFPAGAVLSEEELRFRAMEERIQALEEREEDEWRVYFKEGLKFESRDKKFKYQIGGRIMWDQAYFDADRTFKANNNEPQNGTEFRRARLFISGLLYNHIKFKAQVDFAGQTSFKDVYLGLVKIPVIQNITFGHFKEPFSLEELTSSKYITFMERSLMNAFAPGRNAGIAIYDSQAFDKRATWAIGVFRPVGETPPILNSDDGYHLTLRATALPFYRDQGKKLVHLGIGYTYTTPSGSTFRFRSRPEAHLTSRFVDTGSFSAENASQLGFEGAVVFHAFSIQGEYTRVHVDRPSGLSDVDFDGAYVHVSYFLTGENRRYKKGSFARVKPHHNFLDGSGGLGAWQVAFRYSTLDLNDGAITGGEEDDITLGLNWHLNPNTRIMFNYVYADITGAPGVDLGELNTYQMRFQIDF